jgi:hypothetical protein
MRDHVIGFSPNNEEDSTNVHLHDLLSKYLSHGYGVIYAAESPDSSSSFIQEDSEEIREQQGTRQPYTILNDLAKRIGSNKVNAYLKKGLLTIKDSADILPVHSSMKQLLNSISSLIQDYEPKSSTGIKGKIFFNAPDRFFEEGKLDKFLKFEDSLGKKFDDNFQMICWYRKKWIETLSFPQLVLLLQVHNRTIHNSIKFQAWDADGIVSIISEGINKAVGQDHASHIIFETMQRRFNLDKSMIISTPNHFADTLGRMSPDSAETIMYAVMEEFKNRLSFDNYDAETKKKSAIQERKRIGFGKIGTRRNRGDSNSRTSKRKSGKASTSRKPRRTK